MIKLNFGFLIALLLISPLVSAFGATTPYWDDNPLIMYPGQTKDFALILQNMVGDEDLVLEAELVSGAEIATLVDEELEYSVPFGRKDINVNLRVTIPEDAAPGENYNIEVSFKETPTDEKGEMVQMAGQVITNVPVIVKSESEVPPEEETLQPEEKEKVFPTTAIVLLLVIIFVILVYILSKKKK